MDTRKPNFLFIGPDKSGSTWIYEVLKRHPEVYMSPAKELFYFDYFYEKGLAWYLKAFQDATDIHKVIGEVSHDYLFSPIAARRIKRDLPGVKLMVCLRNPVNRAFSSYLFMIRQGRVNGSFEEALTDMPELIEHGFYAKHLVAYFEIFGKADIHIGLFDQLKTKPDIFVDALFRFLEIESRSLSDDFLKPVLPASYPRSMMLAKFTKALAMRVRSAGWPKVVNMVKGSPIIQRVLFQPYSQAKKPRIREETNKKLKEVFRDDVERLEIMVETNIISLWDF